MTIDKTEHKRKRLIFRSWHRGTKEMDLLLGTFADQNLAGFNAQELDAYEAILGVNDPDLYNWMTGKEAAPANIEGPIFEKIKAHEYKNNA